ncbi:hypothetical protein [Cupriavidus basilensis]|uniref:hypothetical protein n=1 Tax=Cupriavidus basilensis TaxID=68895 RepID=UPI0011466DA2|nr:hypothetical protein [Cupriavidus basilensis]
MPKFRNQRIFPAPFYSYSRVLYPRPGQISGATPHRGLNGRDGGKLEGYEATSAKKRRNADLKGNMRGKSLAIRAIGRLQPVV